MYLLARLIDSEQVCKVDMECAIMYCYATFNKATRYSLREYHETMKSCYGIKATSRETSARPATSVAA